MGLGGRQRPCRMPASGRIAQDFGLFRREVPFKTPSNETSGAAFGPGRTSADGGYDTSGPDGGRVGTSSRRGAIYHPVTGDGGRGVCAGRADLRGGGAGVGLQRRVFPLGPPEGGRGGTQPERR